MQDDESQTICSKSSQKTEICSQNKKSSNQTPTKSKSSSVLEINPRAAYLLLDQVRHSTNLSYEMSKVAVKVIVSRLQEMLPPNVGDYFDAVLAQLQMPLSSTKLNLEETYDANRLKIIFTELTSCKEDSQQRSWMLYEDEQIICEYIKELTSILVSYNIILFSYLMHLFIFENDFNRQMPMQMYQDLF